MNNIIHSPVTEVDLIGIAMVSDLLCYGARTLTRIGIPYFLISPTRLNFSS